MGIIIFNVVASLILIIATNQLIQDIFYMANSPFRFVLEDRRFSKGRKDFELWLTFFLRFIYIFMILRGLMDSLLFAMPESWRVAEHPEWSIKSYIKYAVAGLGGLLFIAAYLQFLHKLGMKSVMLLKLNLLEKALCVQGGTRGLIKSISKGELEHLSLSKEDKFTLENNKEVILSYLNIISADEERKMKIKDF